MPPDNIQEILKELTRQFPITSEEGIKEQIAAEIKEDQRNLQKWLQRENPFQENQKQLNRAENELKRDIATINQLEQDLQNFKSLTKKSGFPIDKNYWFAEIQELKKRATLQSASNLTNSRRGKSKKYDSSKIHEEQIICRNLLLRQWRKVLDQCFSEWEIEQIQNFRKELLKRLQEWLENLQQLADTLDDLSIEPGLLFDLSKDRLSLSDLEQLKRWVEYLSKDKGVKKLCDMLGRLRNVEKAKRQEQIRTQRMVTEFVPDVNSKEEIVGIRLGKEIEHALPHEIALLSDEETAILFEMKFVEGRLMCFDMEGLQANSHEVEEEITIEVEEEEQLGPIIICVDTSGSMQGSPETIAKAITLFMATRAIAQKRNCLLINFSTGIETLDLSGQIGISKAITFLQRSFHGGTDVGPALTYALNMMNEENYQKSDLLIISDFIMASLPEPLLAKVAKAKESNNQFYSLSIGDLFLSERLKEVFDNEWVYNPATSGIHSIHEMVNAI